MFGVKDLQKRSFLHLGSLSLLLKELLKVPTVGCRESGVLSMIVDSSARAQFSPIASIESRGQPQTELTGKGGSTVKMAVKVWVSPKMVRVLHALHAEGPRGGVVCTRGEGGFWS